MSVLGEWEVVGPHSAMSVLPEGVVVDRGGARVVDVDGARVGDDRVGAGYRTMSCPPTRGRVTD